MSRIHIVREHALGLAEARKLACKWAETAEEYLGMRCVYQQGESADRLSFDRAGAHGHIAVTADRFVLDAKLGLLLLAFRHRIETEIVRNLELLLAHEEPLAAFEQAVAARARARHGTRRKA